MLVHIERACDVNSREKFLCVFQLTLFRVLSFSYSSSGSNILCVLRMFKKLFLFINENRKEMEDKHRNAVSEKEMENFFFNNV